MCFFHRFGCATQASSTRPRVLEAVHFMQSVGHVVTLPREVPIRTYVLTYGTGRRASSSRTYSCVSTIIYNSNDGSSLNEEEED
jgi:hypothetical protein